MESRQIPTADIRPGQNDRTTFRAGEIEALADSIRTSGLIQPITVRPVGGGYEIVAGERRFRAIQSLHQSTIAAFVVQMSDDEAAAVMLAENMLREDLDPVDEANAYAKRLANGWAIDRIAEVAGVSTIRVQFRLALLKLQPEIADLVRRGHLPLGYAQILATAGLDGARQHIWIAR